MAEGQHVLPETDTAVPTMGYDAEMLAVEDLDLGDDAEQFPYQPQQKMRPTCHAGLLAG